MDFTSFDRRNLLKFLDCQDLAVMKTIVNQLRLLVEKECHLIYHRSTGVKGGQGQREVD